MGFTATALLGDRYHVSGTDSTGTSGSAVIDGSQWNQVIAHDKHKVAEQTFNDVVEDFFAPLLAAAKEVEQSLVGDDIGTLVLEEGQAGCDSRPAQVLQLSKDSIILRLIENNDTDRLLWVNGNLEILERQDPPAQLGVGANLATE